VVPVVQFVGVVIGEVHVLCLPGRLVVCQLSPLDQVVDVVLPVHTEEHSREMENFTFNDIFYTFA